MKADGRGSFVLPPDDRPAQALVLQVGVPRPAETVKMYGGQGDRRFTR